MVLRWAVIRRANRARTRRDALMLVLRVSTGDSGVSSGLESRRSLRGRCNRLRRELVLGHVRHLRPRGYPSQAAQAVHRQRCERRATAQPRKFHHYGRPGHVGATALKQASRRADGAAGC